MEVFYISSILLRVARVVTVKERVKKKCTKYKQISFGRYERLYDKIEKAYKIILNRRNSNTEANIIMIGNNGMVIMLYIYIYI